MIAILGDEDAPSDIGFDIDLPAGAELVEQEDGSIAVMADVELPAISDAVADRLNAEIEAIAGPDFDGITLTDKQMDALNAIRPSKTTLATQTVQIGTIAAPWAVDANGESVDTHYEITGDGITQVIDADSNTAYPVTADPWWDFIPKTVLAVMKWVGKATVVSNAIFAAALGGWVVKNTKKSNGSCRSESKYSMMVCWGGKLQWMVGGGGTTYG
ncbi:MAG: hypothetical protein LBU38_08285, partial [Propionibacteriaceae bacterium]|nr:hypothetical protein [Propionibacteriaceae bacterium]